MNKYNPVIIVVAFNRPESLKRLLQSLKGVKKIDKAKLIISIDNQEPHNFDVKKIAEEFEWPFGEKEVVYQKQRLGLRKHILQCGDYALTYGSVIILEDDLFVSPYFYDYAVQALNFYSEDENIGGISLYSQPREEITEKLFYPIQDDSSIYFLQFPSSWGQAWTVKQWLKFREWYNTNPYLNEINIPDRVLHWPETSWKKYFCAYLVNFNKYFVFPRISLTTNFNDVGTHLKMVINYDGQAPLKVIDSEYRFIELEQSLCIYDVYFELMASCLNKMNNKFIEFSYELDLFGNKNLSKINTPFILTSRPSTKSLFSFKRSLKPHELNVLFDLQGNDLNFSRKKDVRPVKNKKAQFISDYQYNFSRRLPSIKLLLYNYFLRRFK